MPLLLGIDTGGTYTDAVLFEEFVRKKFLGAKSFSLEGSESLIPLLDLAIEKAGEQSRTLRGRYVLACDGASSPTRKRPRAASKWGRPSRSGPSLIE